MKLKTELKLAFLNLEKNLDKAIRLMPAIFLFLIFLEGCATAPQPRIEGNSYINPKYGFSIEMPNGWQQTEKIPNWMIRELKIYETRPIQIVFINSERTGYILVWCQKSIFDVSSTFSDSMESVRKEYEKHVEKMKMDFKHYTYEISTYIDRYNPPWLLFRDEIHIGEATLIHVDLAYTCHGDDTCAVRLSLITESKSFDEDNKVFKKVVESIRTIE